MSQADTTHSSSVEQLQKLHRRRMTIFGSIILIAGIAIGSASTVILMPHDEPFAGSPGPTGPDAAERMVGHLKRILELTAEQEKDIRLICKTAFATIHDAQAKAKPIIDAAIKKMNDDIAAKLTDEQNAKWKRDIEEWKKRWSERWHRGRRPGEGGPGPDRRRGPGDPNREFRGPGGGRPGDPNRPWMGFGPGDPNRPREGFRRGPGRFGPGDPNRPPGDFDPEAMRERFQRGDRPGPTDVPPPPPIEPMKESKPERE